MFKTIKLFIALAVSICFIVEQTGFAQVVNQPAMPAGYVDFVVKDKFRPLHLRSLTFDQAGKDFNIVLDKGDDKKLTQDQLKEKTRDLLEYFKIGLTLPNNAFWVNLRPDSDAEVIDPLLEKTDLGRILLEADLQLKKDVANFTNPETPLGRQYWEKIYSKAESLFGAEEMTIPTLTRPWIVPGEIIVRESQGSAYIYKATLKVMLEQDYIKDSRIFNFSDERMRALNEYSSQLIRTMIIPKLTKEVNSSKKYASLRQAYYSLILAQWFKHKVASGTPMQSEFSAMINSKDLSRLASKSAWSKATYYQAYKRSFEQGEYAKEETLYTASGPTIRQYVSGGVVIAGPAGQSFKGSSKDGSVSDNEIAGKVVNDQIDLSSNRDGGKDELLSGAKRVLSAVKSKITSSSDKSEEKDIEATTPPKGASQGLFARLKSIPRSQLMNLGVMSVFIGISLLSGAWMLAILPLIITAYSMYKTSKGQTLSKKENAVFWGARVLVLAAIAGTGVGLIAAVAIALGMSGMVSLSNRGINSDRRIYQALGVLGILASIGIAAYLGFSNAASTPDSQPGADQAAQPGQAQPGADQAAQTGQAQQPQMPTQLNVDTNGFGAADLNIDVNNDGIPDLNIDTNNDGRADINIDTDGDGVAGLNLDTNGDGIADANIDANGDKMVDANSPIKDAVNIDTNNDGKADINIDTNNDKFAETNVDTDGDGVADLNVDTNNDGKPDLNIDTNGDRWAGINIDTDGNGKADLNVDTNGDKIADTNTDTTGDGVADKNVNPDIENVPITTPPDTQPDTQAPGFTGQWIVGSLLGGFFAGAATKLLGGKSGKTRIIGLSAVFGLSAVGVAALLGSGLIISAGVFFAGFTIGFLLLKYLSSRSARGDKAAESSGAAAGLANQIKDKYDQIKKMEDELKKLEEAAPSNAVQDYLDMVNDLEVGNEFSIPDDNARYRVTEKELVQGEVTETTPTKTVQSLVKGDQVIIESAGQKKEVNVVANHGRDQLSSGEARIKLTVRDPSTREVSDVTIPLHTQVELVVPGLQGVRAFRVKAVNVETNEEKVFEILPSAQPVKIHGSQAQEEQVKPGAVEPRMAKDLQVGNTFNFANEEAIYTVKDIEELNEVVPAVRITAITRDGQEKVFEVVPAAAPVEIHTQEDVAEKADLAGLGLAMANDLKELDVFSFANEEVTYTVKNVEVLENELVRSLRITVTTSDNQEKVFEIVPSATPVEIHYNLGHAQIMEKDQSLALQIEAAKKELAEMVQKLDGLMEDTLTQEKPRSHEIKDAAEKDYIVYETKDGKDKGVVVEKSDEVVVVAGAKGVVEVKVSAITGAAIYDAKDADTTATEKNEETEKTEETEETEKTMVPASDLKTNDRFSYKGTEYKVVNAETAMANAPGMAGQEVVNIEAVRLEDNQTEQLVLGKDVEVEQLKVSKRTRMVEKGKSIAGKGKSVVSRVKDAVKKRIGLDKDYEQRGLLGKLATNLFRLSKKKAAAAKENVAEKVKEQVADPIAKQKKAAQERAEKVKQDAQKKVEEVQKFANDYKQNKIDPAIKQARDEVKNRVAPAGKAGKDLKQKAADFKAEIKNKKDEVLDSVRGWPAEQKDKARQALDNLNKYLEEQVAEVEKEQPGESKTNDDSTRDGGQGAAIAGVTSFEQLYANLRGLNAILGNRSEEYWNSPEETIDLIEQVRKGEISLQYIAPGLKGSQVEGLRDKVAELIAAEKAQTSASQQSVPWGGKRVALEKIEQALPSAIPAGLSIEPVLTADIAIGKPVVWTQGHTTGVTNIEHLPDGSLIVETATSKYSIRLLEEGVSRDGSKEESVVGGIDFRALPIISQPAMGGVMPLIDARAWQIALEQSKAVDTEKEWRRIQAQLKKGQLPDCAQLKQYVIACSQKDNADQEMGKVLAAVGQMLRVEEDEVLPTGKDLQELLVILDSDDPAQAIKTILQQAQAQTERAVAAS